jgi:predicted aspartyl protease
MNIPYDSAYDPPAPVLSIRLAAPGEPPQVRPLSVVVDTGSDGTLIPTHYLEQVEAIDLGDAILHGVLGEAREVHLYEVDLHIGARLLPSVIVVGDDQGSEVLLGRNVLNKLILLLDGQTGETELFETRPSWR